MFSRNLWLKVPLLFAVVGHAELFEALTGRTEPWWHLGVALVIGAVIIPLGGEWIALDATSLRWRRLGWRVAAGGAILHLSLDTACLSLPWLDTPEWKLGLAGVLLGAFIMAVLLRRYLGALRDPDALAPPAWSPQGESWLARVWRAAAMAGGESILVTAIGAGFVIAALFLLIARPELRGELKLWLALFFFAGCAAAGVMMGVERRALLVGRPGIRWPWRRFLREVHVATRQGLLAVHRRGAFLYRWDDIAAVGPGIVLHHPAVCVLLVDDAAPDPIDGGEVEPALTRLSRTRAVTRALHGVDLAIFSTHTESGAGPLLAQLEEALADPDRRASLPDAGDELRRLRAG